MNEELSERDAYIKKLQDDLLEASLAKKFVDSEEGKYLIDYISGVISTLTDQIISSKKTHDEYLELRAKIDILRRLKQVLEVKSSEKVIQKLSEDLQLASSGE